MLHYSLLYYPITIQLYNTTGFTLWRRPRWLCVPREQHGGVALPVKEGLIVDETLKLFTI